MAPSQPSFEQAAANLEENWIDRHCPNILSLTLEDKEQEAKKAKEICGILGRAIALATTATGTSQEEVDTHGRLMQEATNEVQQEPITSIDTCRQYAKCASLEIFENWILLNLHLTRFEELVRKRWTKMSSTKKRAVLLVAWPNMSVKHRPDMIVFKNDPPLAGSMCPNEFIWPYINLEDLLRPRSLLIFLNSRGRHLPHNFAYSDLELAPLHKVPEERLALHEDNFTMAFVGRKCAKDYGAFIEWDNAVTMDASVKAGRTVRVGHGMQILDIQDSILSFLLRCVYEILDDHDNTSLIEAKLQPEPPSLTDNIETFQTLQILAREAPYRLPSQMDLRRLKALASARRSQAKDHAIALGEDPGYFAETIEDYHNHRIELIPDKTGVAHPLSEDFPLYNIALRHMISDAHCAVFVWDYTCTSLSKIQDLFQKYRGQIKVDADLPFELLENMSELRFFILSISADFIDNIKPAIRASPPLRKYHYTDLTRMQDVRVTWLQHADDFDPEKEPIVWRLLEALYSFEDEEQRDYFTLHSLLDEYERLIHEEPQAKDLVTPYVASHISQLSIMAECLHQFHQFQPWAIKVESNIKDNELYFELRYNRLLRKWNQFKHLSRKFEEPKICKLGNPKDGKFYYPTDKRRTRETVNQMIAAEIALGKFWKAANANWLRHIGTTPAALVQHIIGKRKPQKTSPWVEPIKAQLETNTITGTFDKLAVSSKSKEKTRGPAIAATMEDVSTPLNDASPTKLRVFSVDKRALEVFKTLFHSPDSPNQPGEVAWNDFLHAMISAGFSAEKLQGSAWHFTPKNLDAERSIQFHEPHPSNKLPFTWARRYDRRLDRAFGWGAKSFTLA